MAPRYRWQHATGAVTLGKRDWANASPVVAEIGPQRSLEDKDAASSGLRHPRDIPHRLDADTQ